ncbi:GHKL domain-containing protein [Butyrivibrio sp. DSM 10294]|uniref:sensor histidine kinase n=1 Tax=Butyrivibrio sp. DSM 10294 TaxID=2972457 RepID=UPI00234EAC4B|nr:ATP-binding protein [Butyrivibrio sp. DSM 10294]MDC7292019.1 GHKL domain-containing protein [Butyrivibrio sp. DSM 10294]
MSENDFRIVEQFYGVMIILVRGFFFQALINTFVSEEIMDKTKKMVLSIVVTVEGIILFVVPVKTTGAWTIISFLTILAVFFFYNKTVIPNIFFVYFLWLNMFFVWYIANVVLSDCLSDWLIESMDYSRPDALAFFYKKMLFNMSLEIIFLIVAFIAIYNCIAKICKLRRDMSWTEALFLSIYSVVSYCIAYMIAQVMVVPLDEGVFILLDEKRNLRIALPILALLIFVGEMTAIATWQRYRRLLEEDLLLQEQVQEQEYIRKRIEYTEKYHDQIRTLRHDMAGKLMILKSFLENGKYNDATEFLSEMDVELNSNSMRFFTGNPVTDVVINEAAFQAEKLGCEFTCDFCFTSDKGISAVDMGIVLNNLLDNALEAVSGIPEDKRYIKLLGNLKDNFFLIKIENSFDGKVIRGNDSRIVSRKKGTEDENQHGIGLKSVMRIADKYLGTTDVKSEATVFEVKVMLQRAAG